MLLLRPYQEEAKAAVYAHLRTRDDNPCVVIPTAGGKTPVMASICKDAVGLWRGRVLILAHVKELLEQTADKLNKVCPEVRFGIYSAGLKRRDTANPVIVAGIQSVYKRACELDRFDLVLVDECFVEGTLISTPSGDVPIEQIQPGKFVRNATGIGRVEAVAARPVRKLVTLEYSDGTILTCTPNHPIFTDSGWRAAGSLELGSLAFGLEGVRMLREGFSALDQATGRRQTAGPTGKIVDADRPGVGWAQPPIAAAQDRRFPEDIVPGAKWLVRITHHEPASGSVVFNLQVSGHPSYFANGILVHNCHLIPPEGEGMYRQFLTDAKVINPDLWIIGFTATPFRLKTGPICTPEAATWARAFVEHQTRRMLYMARHHACESEFDGKRKRLLDVLDQWRRQHGDEWMPFWRINRKLPWSHREHEEVRDTLLHQRLIESQVLTTGRRGRPGLFYRLAPTPCATEGTA